MTNAKAWYELGVKQQENEREHKALQALQRAVELDPTHLPSWLALAVSYTNDNNRQGTYDAVEEWVKRNERYASVKLDPAPSAELSMTERYARLVDQLIAMARSDMSGEIDADIQIALAVLLNTNEVKLFGLRLLRDCSLTGEHRIMRKRRIVSGRRWLSAQMYGFVVNGRFFSDDHCRTGCCIIGWEPRWPTADMRGKHSTIITEPSS